MISAGRLCTLLSGALLLFHLVLPTYEISPSGEADGPMGYSLLHLAGARPEVFVLVLPPMIVSLLLLSGVLFPRIVVYLPISLVAGLAAFACWGVSIYGMVFVIGGAKMGFQTFSLGSVIASVCLLAFGFLGFQSWRISGMRVVLRPQLRFLVCLAIVVLMCCPVWEWFVVVKFRSPPPIVTPWFWVGAAAWGGMLVGLRLMIRESREPV